MKALGQIVLIVAIVIMIMTMLLAVIVDAGRLYLQHAQTKRAAQAGSDSGIGVPAEVIVTLAAAQQATAVAAPCGGCTATPNPEQAERWLSDEDRATLISPPIRTQVAIAAIDYASRNGLNPSDPSTLSLQIQYPYDYNAEGSNLRLQVSALKRTALLLVGLLNHEWVELPVVGFSEIRQR